MHAQRWLRGDAGTTIDEVDHDHALALVGVALTTRRLARAASDAARRVDEDHVDVWHRLSLSVASGLTPRWGRASLLAPSAASTRPPRRGTSPAGPRRRSSAGRSPHRRGVRSTA